MTGKVYGEVSVRDYVKAMRQTHGRSIRSWRAKTLLLAVSMALLGYVAGGLLPLTGIGTAHAASKDEGKNNQGSPDVGRTP